LRCARDGQVQGLNSSPDHINITRAADGLAAQSLISVSTRSVILEMVSFDREAP
jgi:hypothetical protein